MLFCIKISKYASKCLSCFSQNFLFISEVVPSKQNSQVVTPSTIHFRKSCYSMVVAKLFRSSSVAFVAHCYCCPVVVYVDDGLCFCGLLFFRPSAAKRSTAHGAKRFSTTSTLVVRRRRDDDIYDFDGISLEAAAAVAAAAALSEKCRAK